MKKYYSKNLNSRIIGEFFQAQLERWSLAKKNYASLKLAQYKSFSFGQSVVRAQFNPERVVSTLAETDEKSIEKRKCFLCEENLFKEQMGLPVTDNFTLLVNPYPVLSEHFTIKHNLHVRQKIDENFSEFLYTGRVMGEKYFVLYNGPDCGASVPEHRHFQAGIADELNLINEIKSKINARGNHHELTKIELGEGVCESYLASDNLRAFFLLVASKESELTETFFSLFALLENNFPSERETKINLILFMFDNKFHLLVIPRKKHRPDIFYEVLEPVKISPATLDIGGVVVIPFERDFRKLDENTIKNVFDDVLYDKNELKKILS